MAEYELKVGTSVKVDSFGGVLTGKVVEFKDEALPRCWKLRRPTRTWVRVLLKPGTHRAGSCFDNDWYLLRNVVPPPCVVTRGEFHKLWITEYEWNVVR